MSELKILSLDEVRNAQDIAEEVVPVPEWGGAVRVRGVNIEQGMALYEQIQGPDGKLDTNKAMLYAVVAGVVEPKFSESDLPWLRQKSMAALARITEAFNRLSGFDQLAASTSKKNS